MREIVVISGKGGAGKTSITSAFAHLADKAIICDYDVDTPDLHILLSPETYESHEFWSGHEALIDKEKCTACGQCAELCRFDALSLKDDKYYVNGLFCEGCMVCVEFCPEKAINFPEKNCGNWYLSNTRFGTMVHARLFPGEENSGLLVSLLKSKAQKIAKEEGFELILSDGAPGIGCPVISSLRGASLAVIVTEPTPSGKHDFERVATLCDQFRLPVAVLVNKADLNLNKTQEIKNICLEKSYSYLGEIPYDNSIVEAMMDKKVVTELKDSPCAEPLKEIWEKISELAYK